MKRRTALQAITGLSGLALAGSAVLARQNGQPLSANITKTPYRDVADCHKGAGTIRLTSIINADTFETNFHAVSRAELPPGTSIGEHIHRHMEEMFIILNAPAQYTVDGHTAELPAGSCVSCLMGHSHGIYNHTDQTLQWLYFAVTEEKGKGDAIDFGDGLLKLKVHTVATLCGNF